MVVNAAAQTVLVPVNYVLEVDADGPTRVPCKIAVGGMIVIAPEPVLASVLALAVVLSLGS